MKLIRIFLTLQYVSLAGITAIPLILAAEFSNEIHRSLPAIVDIFLLTLILFVLFMTIVFEALALKKVNRFISTDENEKAVKAWRQLKLVSVPFYVINFILCFVFAPISFPLSLITIPLNLFFCWIMIIISGVVGIKVIKAAQSKKSRFSAHYVLQVLPVLDVVSTLILKNKVKFKEKAAV